MNSEPKAFASLSSGLLARKGAAKPAMRPQGFAQGAHGLEDLGWNDMGFEPPRPDLAPVRDEDHDAFGEELPEEPVRHAHAGLTPVQSPVHSQQAEIAGRLKSEEDEETAEGEEYDETAELYDPEGEIAAEPEIASQEAPDAVLVANVGPLIERRPDPVPAPLRAPKARSAPGGKSKAAFTLRLDHARHLKLRLACAVNGRSAQLLVTDALDQLLAAMPELEAMAAKANRKD